MSIPNRDFVLYARNFIFGAEDSLVSTVGLLAGVSAAEISQRSIIVSGIILICVEAFSMGVGSFLSQSATEESPLDTEEKGHNPRIDALIMFFSYFVCGLIPLSPYFFTPTATAFWYSITASLIALAALGIVSAKILNIAKAKNALRMVVYGGLAISFGVVVGMLLK